MERSHPHSPSHRPAVAAMIPLCLGRGGSALNSSPALVRLLAAFRHVCSAPRRRLIGVIFVVSLALYLSNGRIVAQVDSGPNSLFPIALLTHGSLTFDGIIDASTSRRPPYFVQTPDGIVSFYPIAVGLMAVPIYAAPVAIEMAMTSPSPADWVRFAYHFQKFAAAILAALAVVAFWRLCEAIELSRAVSLGLTAWFALGSEIFSIGAQSLWQHGPGTLAIIGAACAQVRLRTRPSSADALLLSVWCGLAVAIRPTNLLIVAPFAFAALLLRPRLVLQLALPAAVILALVALYNIHFFADLLGGYGGFRHRFSLAGVAAGFMGLLFSPSRGLLIYFPASILAVGLLAVKPRMMSNATAAAAIAAILLSIAVTSSYSEWWGGYSYGPRLLSEIEPLVLLLIGLAWQNFSVRARRPIAMACFGVLLPYSVFVQAVGVYTVSAWNWTGTPVDIMQAPERLWDFADNPILRGLRGHVPAGI
jgi:hypothetical protein